MDEYWVLVFIGTLISLAAGVVVAGVLFWSAAGVFLTMKKESTDAFTLNNEIKRLNFEIKKLKAVKSVDHRSDHNA